MALELPQKGFTRSERAWLAQLLIEIKNARAIAGDNVTISDSAAGDGQVINGDCPDCV
jgi:hypothetical protein